MAQLKDLIVNGPSRFIGDVYATTFTGDLNGNASTATSATNASTIAGLSVHSGRNNEANKIVRTDGTGYLQVGYINSSDGHEKNASSPTYVWGSNSSDSYLRSYQTSSLSVKYATTSGTCSGNAVTATKATQDGNGNIITSTYLPLSGGTMDSGAGIKWSDRTSSTWDTFGLDANTGLQILNTVGVSSTNAPSDYSVGLSVSGYYGFCLAYYGGGNDWWLKGNSDEDWKTIIHSGNISSQSVKYATTAGSAPASDVYSWAKQSTKPSYSFSEITSKPTTVSGYGITDALTTSNYTTYTVKKDGTGASGTWGISITGNAATATELYSTIVHPFNSSVFAYRKFASINVKQYEGKTALLLLKSYSTPSTLYGNSCKVYVNVYQQASLGTSPRYNIETDCDDRFFSIYAVVNYTSTLSTVDLYVYGKEMAWYSIDVTLLSGDNIIDIGDVINNLPAGVVITPTKYGSVYSATKLATARTITLTGSVTGSVSLDGSADVTLETTTNHTHTGSEVILTGYSHHDSYETINETDTVNQAIGKLERALSGLEDLLASI